MSRQWATRLAWAVCAIAIALTFTALVFLILNRSTPGVSTGGYSDGWQGRVAWTLGGVLIG